MEKFKSVFDSYPDAQIIFVVGDMPFLEARHAESHSRSTGQPVIPIHRPKDEEPSDESAEPKKGKKGK